MPRPDAQPIVLRRGIRLSLEALTRSTRAAYAHVTRARIILLAALGESNAEVSRQVGWGVKTVRKWRARFAARPKIETLKDERRVGRPSTIPRVARLELIKLACERAKDCKAPFRDVWTADSLRVALECTTGFKMVSPARRHVLSSIMAWRHTRVNENECRAVGGTRTRLARERGDRRAIREVHRMSR